MRLRLSAGDSPAVARLASELEREMVHAVDVREALPALLLRSPDGTIWRVTVSNAGALSTVAVQGPSA
jgi:hypothetical protein